MPKTTADHYPNRIIFLAALVSLSLFCTYFMLVPLYNQKLETEVLIDQAPLTSPTVNTSTDPPTIETPSSDFGRNTSPGLQAKASRLPGPTVVFLPGYVTANEWAFNSTRDAGNYGLSTEQCHAAFPHLFQELERAASYRKTVGRITSADVDLSWTKSGVVRAMIVEQQLYVLEAKISDSSYDTTRALAVLHAIHRAIITSPTPLPNIEFSFCTSDIPDPAHVGRAIWALTRKASQPEKWLMSDFGYWSWPLGLVGGYEQIRRQISEVEDGLEFGSKIKLAVWRGAVKTNNHRQELLNVVKGGEHWADVKSIKWANERKVMRKDEGVAISIPDHCRYQFVIHTEGHSYSGRLKYLQNCNSVLITHSRTWIEPHHHLLISSGPNQNFVEVQDNFSDLEHAVLSLLADQAKAKRIAKNSVSTFRDRYLTPASQACYWRALIRAWADVSFVPEKWEADGAVIGDRKIRGTPFESFAIQAVMPSKATCSWLDQLIFKC